MRAPTYNASDLVRTNADARSFGTGLILRVQRWRGEYLYHVVWSSETRVNYKYGVHREGELRSNVDPPESPSTERAMYLWGSTDVLNGSNALISFCSQESVSTLFLDMYSLLGASNGSPTNTAAVQSVISRFKALGSSQKVYALAGDVDWSTAGPQGWIAANITQKIVDYNDASAANEKFDGFTLDVEYWTGAQDTAEAVDGVATLIATMKSSLGLPVGLFASFYLLDGAGTRPSVLYNGSTKQDGRHLVDIADHVVVGAYRSAADPFSDQNGQIQLFQPWMDNAGSKPLYCACELEDVGDSNVSYFGQSKAYLDGEQAKIVTQFEGQSDFAGLAFHSYTSWKDYA